MSATTLNTARPEWFPGQVTVDSRSDFRVVMEGKATNGGFAIDQLVFSRGKCDSKYYRVQNFPSLITALKISNQTFLYIVILKQSDYIIRIEK